MIRIIIYESELVEYIPWHILDKSIGSESSYKLINGKMKDQILHTKTMSLLQGTVNMKKLPHETCAIEHFWTILCLGLQKLQQRN